MSLGPSNSSTHRMKLGLVFLSLGVVLMIWAWGNWIYRSSNGMGESTALVDRSAGTQSPTAMQALKASPFVLMVGLFLVLVFLVGSYAIVRGSRRLREAILHEKARPTMSDDVWAMHKAPKLDSGEDE